MMKNTEARANTRTEVVMPREGGPEVLETHRRDLAAPGPGQVVVRVEAAGVAFSEVQMLKGRYFGQPRFPFVPGYDLVGEVEGVGEGVDGEMLGARVAALTQTGAWADRVVLDAVDVTPVPASLDPADAVAAVTNGVTAWQMLHRAASVRSGQTVLVHGASGGVGTLLVQLARLAGAEVIGTASARKHDYVRSLGAVPVDYKGDVPARVREISPGGVDAVFDHVGGPGLVDSYGMLRRGGTLVTYGSASTLNSSTGHWIKPYLPIFARVLRWNVTPDGKKATFYYVKRWPRFFQEDLSAVLSLLSSGEIEAHATTRMPLEKAAEALEFLASGRASGKVVLVPEPGTRPSH